LFKGAKRADQRLAETILGCGSPSLDFYFNVDLANSSYVTGAASYFTSNLEIHVSVLAKAIMKAGVLGSSGLSPAVGATKAGQEDARFTLVGNKGALVLAQEK
jgi:oxidoreductase